MTCRMPLPLCLRESQASRFNIWTFSLVFDCIASVHGAKLLKHGTVYKFKALLLWDI